MSPHERFQQPRQPSPARLRYLYKQGPPKSALGSSRLGSDTARGQHLASSGDDNDGEANTTEDTSGCRPTYSAQTDARPVTLVAASSGNDASAN